MLPARPFFDPECSSPFPIVFCFTAWSSPLLVLLVIPARLLFPPHTILYCRRLPFVFRPVLSTFWYFLLQVIVTCFSDCFLPFLVFLVIPDRLLFSTLFFAPYSIPYRMQSPFVPRPVLSPSYCSLLRAIVFCFSPCSVLYSIAYPRRSSFIIICHVFTYAWMPEVHKKLLFSSRSLPPSASPSSSPSLSSLSLFITTREL